VRSARITALVVLVGAIAGGLVLDAADRSSSRGGAEPTVRAGVALPAARDEPSLSSTWYCAGGTAANPADDLADHVLLLANPTDRARRATVTILSGAIAPAPAPERTTPTTVAGQAPASTTTSAPPATTAPPSTTPRAAPVQQALELPPQSRTELRLADVAGVTGPLAGAVVEADGGRIAVEHQITGSLGRATAPCSTTASTTWSFPWGVTLRGSRELLVFMNPFPDDATVDIAFATDEGVRETARFQGFIVPGRSVVGAYIDEDVTRKAQVSAQVQVRGGRLVVDRIQTFDGTDGREGMTLGLGAPTPALTWMYPVGETGPGLAEQVVVFNPSDRVAEVRVEARLDDPAAEPPEPFDLTVAPNRFSIVNVHEEGRVPPGVGHALIVRSVNRVPVTAERVNSAADPAPRRGVSAITGSPVGAPTWYFPGGGPVQAERDEYLVLLNVSDTRAVGFRVTGFSKGQTIAIQGLQEGKVPAGGRVVIRLGDHIDRDDLPVIVTADGPIVVERGLYRIGGGGMAQSIGIPLDRSIFIPAPARG
jgi:hypothetical protein